MAKLTVLSYGGGQDSDALLQLYIHDAAFRAKYAPNQFIVVMSDTGDEHPRTRQHVKMTQAYCKEKGVEFWHITPDLGFHHPSWLSLRWFYKLFDTVGCKAFNKSCTDQLKIQPFYRFLDRYVSVKYGLVYGRKRALKAFAQKYGKIDVLIGLSKGEESRVNNGLNIPLWQQQTIRIRYPLIDLGMDRRGCQEYIASCNRPVPFPSNCMLCPWMSEVELLWLFRHHPDDFWVWVGMEQNKLKKFAHLGDKNLGVWGKKHLLQVLEEAKTKYGHMTNEELDQYKFERGHCVKSKY